MPDDPQYTQIALTKPVDLDQLNSTHLTVGEQNGTKFRFDSNSLTERVRQMFTHLDGLEKERAMKAVLCGIYLAEIKAKTAHGEFTSWIQQNFPNSDRRARHYMALAAKFSRSSKLLLPELIAANQISLALEAPDATGEALMAKLDKFVGTSGLTELLTRHGIVKRGGNRHTTTQDTPAPDAKAEPEPTLEEGAVAAFTNVFNAIDEAERVLLSETNWALLDVEKAEMLEGKLKSLAASFHERALRLRHERTA